MCHYLSFAVGSKGKKRGNIYAGLRLDSHSGIEAKNKLKPDEYCECEWTGEGKSSLVIRVYNGPRNLEGDLRKSILSRFHTRQALVEYIKEECATPESRRRDCCSLILSDSRTYRRDADRAFAKLEQVNRRTGGRILLHKAVERGNLDAVKRLLKLGANPNARDNVKRTSLHKLAGFGRHRDDICKALLAAGAKLNARDIYKQTPLHVAAADNSAANCRRLLLAGASPNVKDNGEDTPEARIPRWGHWAKRIYKKTLQEVKAKNVD